MNIDQIVFIVEDRGIYVKKIAALFYQESETRRQLNLRSIILTDGQRWHPKNVFTTIEDAQECLRAYLENAE